MRNKTVVILQEYVPAYRVPFFDHLVSEGASRGIRIIVGAGQPSSDLLARKDAVRADYVVALPQSEIGVGRLRLVYRKVNRLAKQADLVIAEQARRNLDSYRAFFPRRFRKCGWALWGHGRDYVDRKSRISVAVYNALTRRSDWFFAYTPRGAEHVQAVGVPAKRTTVVMNAVDTGLLRKKLCNQSNTLETQPAPVFERPVVTFMGALDETKRLDFLLCALRKLNTWQIPFDAVIAGEGSQSESLRREAADMDNVRFVGRVDGDQKAELLSVSEVLAIPGRVGLVAVESLVSGTPIVTTDWEYHAPEFEYLEDNVTCVVTENNVNSYALGLRTLLENAELRKRLSEQCRVAGRPLTIENMAANFLDGIVKALEKGPIR